MAEKEKKFWAGFDLGGTKMQATIYDDGFKILAARRRKTRAQDGAGNGVDRMIQTVSEAVEEAGLRTGQLAGIGVGCPGPLDLDKGILLDTPNLGWKNVKLAQQLEDALDCPAVILNDVDAGVYGEYSFGAAKGARCALGIFPGTGIGGGCVYEGEIVRGKTSSCMEIGHIQVVPEGPLCGCGRRGCLEAVAGRLAIAAACAAAAYRGEAPFLLAKAGTDISGIRSGALAASVKGGDIAVEKIVREAARQIGVAAANAINLLAPDILVLGGGLVEAMPELFCGEVKRAAEERVMDSFRGTFRVVEAELGDDAAGMGAAAWARHKHGDS
ncbi:MAG: ROK family protein [Acidobacteria bacterium]|nr:ROK family protein [Acidobacteriota bacterium]